VLVVSAMILVRASVAVDKVCAACTGYARRAPAVARAIAMLVRTLKCFIFFFLTVDRCLDVWEIREWMQVTQATVELKGPQYLTSRVHTRIARSLTFI
jgi:hypothetical protein